MTFKRLFTALFVAAALSTLSASARAADSADFTLNDIRFNNQGQLFLNTSDGWYWAKPVDDGTACLAVSADQRKSWLSMAQSSILSGKKLHAVYNTCASGYRGIQELWLLK